MDNLIGLSYFNMQPAERRFEMFYGRNWFYKPNKE